jgi:hypothetical protein
MIIAAKIYTFFAGFLMLFQLALMFGAPWGVMTQGGFNTGTLPISGRITAGLSVLLLIVLIHVVLTHAGLVRGIGPAKKRWALYVAAVIATLSAIANYLTPSIPERMMGAPVATILLVTVVIVLLRSREQAAQGGQN